MVIQHTSGSDENATLEGEKDKPTALYLFAGIGGGSLGFKEAGFRGVGAIDFDAAACRDYEALVGEPATQADLGEMTPAELLELVPEVPDVVFASPPCKAFSGCLPAELAQTEKYQDMCSLTERCIFLITSTWKTPPPLIVLENVPRIMSRGKEWLERCEQMLEAEGYAVHGSSHDCGELGGLAQRRRRYLLVARHKSQVPEWLYRPPSQRVRGVGEVLSELPVPYPGQTEGGPLHRLDRLSPLNWARLAAIPAGKDWSSLPEQLAVSVDDDAPSLEDPRLACSPRSGTYGVRGWDDPSVTVIGQARIDTGAFAVADPRSVCHRRDGSMGIRAWNQHSITVIAHGSLHNGPWQVGDPRVGGPEDAELATPTHALLDLDPPLLVGPPVEITSRKAVHMVIQAPDGTWHRPFTTLELLALQGFPVKFTDGSWVDLDGGNKRAKRARIGNAVPPPAAAAIGRSCLETLEHARNGTFFMSAAAVWVAPEHVEDRAPAA